MIGFNHPPASMFERTRIWMGSTARLIISHNIAGLFLNQVAILLIFLSSVACASGQVVYVTRTGAKYHRGDCRYLHSSKIETKLADAKANYTACCVCKPPTEIKVMQKGDTVSVQATPNNSRHTPSSNNKASVSQQCEGLTKAGLRCKRVTTNGNGKCWQHQ